MLADSKGFAAGEVSHSSVTDKLAMEAFYAMKTWNIRSIGSPDGLMQPSGQS